MIAKTVKKWGRPIMIGIFVVYLVVLAYFLFFSERYGRGVSGEYRYNLVPLREIKRFIKYRDIIGWEGFIVNIFGNVLAFAPFGFLLPIVSKQNRAFFIVALYSFEFSLFIELIQLSFQVGTFDVDDLLMNTIGGVLGYLFFLTQKKRLCHFL